MLLSAPGGDFTINGLPNLASAIKVMNILNRIFLTNFKTIKFQSKLFKFIEICKQFGLQGLFS